MKNLIGLIFLILVVAGCSFLDKKEEINNDAPNKKIETITETTTEKFDSKLTLEKFNRLENGITYKNAVRVLGGEGVETSSYSSGSLKTVTYKWEGEKYARITLVFKNDELSSKIQSGLKSANDNNTLSKSDLSLAKYNQLQNGLSYDESVRIIGSEGTQTSNSTIGKMKIASYKWEGDKYRRIFATFRNDKLTSKSQSNLK